MGRNIFALRIERGTFGDGRARLYVSFAPNKGETVAEFEWTPRWMEAGRGVADLVREAIRVEKANRPGSEFLREFAEVTRDILIEHAPPIEIEILEGRFRRYFRDDAGRPSVEVQRGHWVNSSRWWDDGTTVLPLGVPLHEELLRELAEGGALEWVVWNREIIDVRLDARSLIHPQK